MSSVKAQVVAIKEKPVSKEHYEELEKFIDGLDTKEGALINVLHKAQGLVGYLPREIMKFIADKLDISAAEVFGVVSFYSFFSTKPVGKCRFSVCMGTACFVKGSNVILEAFEKELGIKSGETTPDGLFTLRDVRCIGACGLAPVLTAEEKVYGHISVNDVPKIIEEQRERLADMNEF